MARGLSAPLSPNEETTMRRIAYGSMPPQSLRDADVRRLESLGLVEVEARGPHLTALGEQRYRALVRPSGEILEKS